MRKHWRMRQPVRDAELRRVCLPFAQSQGESPRPKHRAMSKALRVADSPHGPLHPDRLLSRVGGRFAVKGQHRLCLPVQYSETSWQCRS